MATRITPGTGTRGFTILEAHRCVVRTSGGTLYAIFEDTVNSDCEVWKSSDGSSWTEQDSGNKPGAGPDQVSGNCAAAIDSSGVIHIVIYGGANDTMYVQFSTSTDSFSGFVDNAIAHDGPSNRRAGIAVDSSGKVHFAVVGSAKIKGTQTGHIYYKNNVTDGFGVDAVADATVDVGGSGEHMGFPDITFDSSDYPVVAYIDVFNSALKAAIGNANEATSFTLQTLDSTVQTGTGQSPSVAIDSSDSIWIAYIDSNDDLKIIEHQDGDGWSTWQTAATIDSTYNWASPSLVIDGTDLYVFARDTSDSYIYYYKNTGSGWGSRTLLESAETYDHVRAKWAKHHNNQGSTQIDYLLQPSAGDDIYWNKLDLGAGPVAVVKDVIGGGIVPFAR